MNLKKLLALAAALTLMLAIAACGTPATNHDDAYTTVTTEAPTLPPEEVVDFSRVFVDGVNVPGAQILI
ncbi:MAG: hypothetical protein FWB76_02820, partial [Oscillospiraceae bacterium]|nr:hypothetical protein [Oscillospiraceae bacterium]